MSISLKILIVNLEVSSFFSNKHAYFPLFSIVGFMGLQTAKSMGYIDVDWKKIRDDAIKPLDAVSMN